MYLYYKVYTTVAYFVQWWQCSIALFCGLQERHAEEVRKKKLSQSEDGNAAAGDAAKWLTDRWIPSS